MKFWKFYHWYGTWTWGLALDRYGFTLLLGPFMVYCIWRDK